MFRRFFQVHNDHTIGNGAPNRLTEQDVDTVLQGLCALQRAPDGRIQRLDDGQFLRMAPFLNLLDRWNGRSTAQHAWEFRPRLYTLLRAANALRLMEPLVAQGVTDMDIPFDSLTLPALVTDVDMRNRILLLQSAVFTEAHQMESRDHHFHIDGTVKDYFTRVGRLGTGRNAVDQVYSRLSLKHYARKYVVRGRDTPKSRQELKRIFEEIRLLKKLNQRHLVRIAGSYTDKDTIGILLEPVAQCNLREFMINYCQLVDSQEPKMLLRSFFGCLAGAIAYLHSKNVRHRDLKPHNILIVFDDVTQVYVADFDAALEWTDGKNGTTQHQVTPRTREYMAPETAKQGSRRNAMTDMWSLGLIFLEMVTVLKGTKLSTWTKYLAQQSAKNNTDSLPCHNVKACKDFLNYLRRKDDADTMNNVPLAWITYLLDEIPDNRLDSKRLVKEIVDSPYQQDFCCRECMTEFEDPDYFSQDHDIMEYDEKEAKRETMQREMAAFRDSPEAASASQLPTTKLVSSISNWLDASLVANMNPFASKHILGTESHAPVEDRSEIDAKPWSIKGVSLNPFHPHSVVPGAFDNFSEADFAEDYQSDDVEDGMSEDLASVDDRADTDVQTRWVPYRIVEDGNESEDSISFDGGIQVDAYGLLAPIEEDSTDLINTTDLVSSRSFCLQSKNLSTPSLQNLGEGNLPFADHATTGLYIKPVSEVIGPAPVLNGVILPDEEHGLDQGSARQVGIAIESIDMHAESSPPTDRPTETEDEVGKFSEGSYSHDVMKVADTRRGSRAAGGESDGSVSVATKVRIPHERPDSSSMSQDNSATAKSRNDSSVKQEQLNSSALEIVDPKAKRMDDATKSNSKKCFSEQTGLTADKDLAASTSRFARANVHNQLIQGDAAVNKKKQSGIQQPISSHAKSFSSTTSTEKPDVPHQSQSNIRISEKAAQAKEETSLERAAKKPDVPHQSQSNIRISEKAAQAKEETSLERAAKKLDVPHQSQSNIRTSEKAAQAKEETSLERAAKKPDVPHQSQSNIRISDKAAQAKEEASSERAAKKKGQPKLQKISESKTKDDAAKQAPEPRSVTNMTENSMSSTLFKGPHIVAAEPPPTYEASQAQQRVNGHFMQPELGSAQGILQHAEAMSRRGPLGKLHTSTGQTSKSGWTKQRTARRAENFKSFALSTKNISKLDSMTKPKPGQAKAAREPFKFDPSTYINKAFDILELPASEVSSTISESTSKRLKLARYMMPTGVSALEEHCYKGQPGAVSSLLKRGFNPGTTARPAPRPLFFAMKKHTSKHTSCIRRLIDFGCDVNAPFNNKRPIHRLIDGPYFDDYYRRAALLLMAGADLNIPDMNGNYCLIKILGGPMDQLEEYRLQMLAMLLHKKLPTTVDINVKDPVTLSSPLHLAIRRRQPIAVGMLIHRGANVNAVDATGTTPLSMAANQWKGELKLEEEMCLNSLLEAKKIQVDEVSGTHKRTALHLAILAGSALAVEMLLERNASVRMKDGTGKDAMGLLKQVKKAIGDDIFAQIKSLITDDP